MESSLSAKVRTRINNHGWYIVMENTGEEIIRIIKAAGKRGITKGEVSRALSEKGCDCENWINTLLEAGVIQKCGKRNGADLFRFLE
ncbi:MAG: hypothetical protein OEW87_14040 [Flavobacteriaceae bacterium]|nr:hypothetical protein [Flavobacteriaceae bacterium]